MSPSRPSALAIVGILALVASFVLGSLARPARSDEKDPPSAPPEDGLTGSRDDPLPGGAPEIRQYKNKVVFVIDASGSMAFADRFGVALTALERLVSDLPENTLFDVYLGGTHQRSLFDGNWLRPLERVRSTIRARVEAAGGVDHRSFSDLAEGIVRPIRDRRPEALYLLTDGVQTTGALDTDALVEEVTDGLTRLPTPVHPIAIGLGAHWAEDASQARALLQEIAARTGGAYREVRPEALVSRTVKPGRAYQLRPHDEPQPAEDLAWIALRQPGGKEIRHRNLSAASTAASGRANDVLIEVRDPSLERGPTILEYAAVRLRVRTFLASGRLFAQTREITLIQQEDGRLVSSHPVAFVPPRADLVRGRLNDRGALEVPCPFSIEFVYERDGREFIEAATFDR